MQEEASGSCSSASRHRDKVGSMSESCHGSSPSSGRSGRKDDQRAIRRIRSPSRPRARLSLSYKPKCVGHFYKHRYERLGYKPNFNNQNYHSSFYRHAHKRDPFKASHHYTARPGGNAWHREREKGRPEPRVSVGQGSSVKKNSTVSSRSTSSRDKDTQLAAGQIDRNQSRERDHRGSKGKDGEHGELPSTVSQTTARDRAIRQKRREIDEMYYQDCEMFGVVTKMLIAKDPSLEQPIQLSLQENLRDIGERCVEAMQKFIEEYDSRASR